MMRKIYLIMCFVIVLMLEACGKKEKEPETIMVGKAGNQINVESVNAPDSEINGGKSDLEINDERSDTIVIVIDWDKIIINDSEYSDIEEMKDQIVKSGCKKITLEHTDASKETLDEVIDVLKKIEETLEIDVNYN